MKTLRRYLKNLFESAKQIVKDNIHKYKFTSVNLYFQDESRFGLMTIQRRVLTIKGVKPIQPFQHKFKNTYLYGAYSPLTGDHYTLELPECNTDWFQLFLNEFSKDKPNELKIIVLDNGAFHKAKRLKIPPDIKLVFLPAYTPELNPAEKIWRHIKDKIATKIYKTLTCLSDELCHIIKNLTPQTIKSITGYKFYLDTMNAVL